ncbi:rNA methyltransferase TrmH family [Alistipes putredinis CAG:67]|nr:rNA methyltransferase TrmH family [Alistipes putredinis CAG:67]
MTKAEIQLVRSLADKRSRTEHGLFVAEGHKFIGELCTSALRVRKIFALEGLFEGGEVETVSSREMERLSLLKTPSDSLALVEIPHHPFRPDTAQRELVLALDQVQNPGNLGTIIRLADWFGIPEIVWSPTTADFYNPKGVQATATTRRSCRRPWGPSCGSKSTTRPSNRTWHRLGSGIFPFTGLSSRGKTSTRHPLRRAGSS